MKCNLLFLIVMLPLATIFAEENKRILEGMSLTSALLGQDVRYSIVLPKDYFKSKRNYPVVYLLHGLGDDESSWLEYGRISQIADHAVARKEITPMIFVMPQGFRNYYVNDYAGTFLYEDMFIKELVPFIDKTYRTLADPRHRAVMGYSMGGYGALVFPVKHPDVFSISVPLSTSFRTDAQYMVEDASEWNDQWGRLFGGVGKIGTERLTEHYKKYSPFYFFNKGNAQSFSKLNLFIDNGDDEYTLCRSNEELHILLRDLGIQHEFRVRDGGHEFAFWREALPNALHFISDCLNGTAYRGDVEVQFKKSKSSRPEILERENYTIVLPPGYRYASRDYPAVYLFGEFSSDRKNAIAHLAQKGMADGALPQLLLVFMNKTNASFIDDIIPEVETVYNARNGYRFRALMGFEEGGVTALQYGLMPERFTSCVLFDAPVDTNLLKEVIFSHKDALRKTWLYISTTDTDMDYETNGMAHILLREHDVYHEYQVAEGGRAVQVSDSRLIKALQFTAEKIHR